MRQHGARAQQQRRVVQPKAGPEPVGRRHQRGHRGLRVRCVEQPGDVGAGPGRPIEHVQPGDPRGTPAHSPCASHAKKAVADREARLDAVLKQDVEALIAQDPGWIGRRLQRMLHVHTLVCPRVVRACISGGADCGRQARLSSTHKSLRSPLSALPGSSGHEDLVRPACRKALRFRR
jgi:hypothetical protein